jgi:hypothetical protein
MGTKDGLPRVARNDGVVTADPASEIPGVVGTRPDGAHPGEPMPMPEPEGGWPADEFTGVGGSYVRDPFTGLRSRVEPVAE